METEKDKEVVEFAKYCVPRLEKIAPVGQRKFVPSVEELNAVRVSTT